MYKQFERLRASWSSRVEPGLYQGRRAALLPADAALSLLAKRSYPLFRVWHRWAAATDGWFSGTAPEVSAPDADVLATLRAQGTAMTAGGYDAAAVRSARDWVVAQADRARTLAGEDRTITKHDLDGVVAEVMPLDGRVRLFFSPTVLARADMPNVIRRFADDPRCRALTAAYFDCAPRDMLAATPYYMAEVMTPATKLESWHIDCLRPTIKCFLLLDDIGEEQAPLRYIDRSHLVDEARLRLFYRIARGGLGAAYFDDGAAADYDRQARHVVGTAGSLVVFDSRGIHAGSICRSGTRITLANGYRPPRARRLSPRLFRDPEQTPYPWER